MNIITLKKIADTETQIKVVSLFFINGFGAKPIFLCPV